MVENGGELVGIGWEWLGMVGNRWEWWGRVGNGWPIELIFSQLVLKLYVPKIG